VKSFETSSAKALELSRQETIDGVEERDGSRGVYTKQVAPVLENLDTFTMRSKGT